MSQLRDDELLIEREFDAPVALVFRLWADRAHVMRWWGPEEFTTVELDWELTPGRPWRGAMTATEYGLCKFGGTVLEVEPERRIVFTFQWDEDSGRDLDTVATVRFAERDGRTIQTFHQAPFSSAAVRDSHVGGWDSLFNKQQLYVENFAVAERAGLHP
ncbi:SRPBCC domain-containing protein [Luteimonas sp. RD2P54]|uniref:SRPBCC domain-containing protein n=1 Tax=Luteimonas endophytica TaxID=3042023 RepID=A0ABT6J7A9_9GAMM|nr:SRPBCC domain-containing protein [Luteimonas endophytica]MDH5822714.1 SRPBCC domain-containing protein [Luteimonas endophytica]